MLFKGASRLVIGMTCFDPSKWCRGSFIRHTTQTWSMDTNDGSKFINSRGLDGGHGLVIISYCQRVTLCHWRCVGI